MLGAQTQSELTDKRFPQRSDYSCKDVDHIIIITISTVYIQTWFPGCKRYLCTCCVCAARRGPLTSSRCANTVSYKGKSILDSLKSCSVMLLVQYLQNKGKNRLTQDSQSEDLTYFQVRAGDYCVVFRPLRNTQRLCEVQIFLFIGLPQEMCFVVPAEGRCSRIRSWSQSASRLPVYYHLFNKSVSEWETIRLWRRRLVGCIRQKRPEYT